MKPTQQRSRRGFMLGAAAASAAAAAVASLPAVRQQALPAEAQAQPEPPANGGGYRLSEHVQRYYKSTRI